MPFFLIVIVAVLFNIVIKHWFGESVSAVINSVLNIVGIFGLLLVLKRFKAISKEFIDINARRMACILTDKPVTNVGKEEEEKEKKKRG